MDSLYYKGSFSHNYAQTMYNNFGQSWKLYPEEKLIGKINKHDP